MVNDVDDSHHIGNVDIIVLVRIGHTLVENFDRLIMDMVDDAYDICDIHIAISIHITFREYFDVESLILTQHDLDVFTGKFDTACLGSISILIDGYALSGFKGEGT